MPLAAAIIKPTAHRAPTRKITIIASFAEAATDFYRLLLVLPGCAPHRGFIQKPYTTGQSVDILAALTMDLFASAQHTTHAGFDEWSQEKIL